LRPNQKEKSANLNYSLFALLTGIEGCLFFLTVVHD